MACSVPRPVEIGVFVDTKNQTHEQVLAIVDSILRANGAIECGIMAHFSITLGKRSEPRPESDPSPDLKKLGVTSLTKTEV
jgi:hypothetical protein